MIPVHVQMFAIFAFGAVGLCLAAAWSRRRTLHRWLLIGLALTVAAAAWPAFSMLLSRPRPVAEEWVHRDAAEALVAGVYVDEGRALYLYLVIPGVDEPRSYSLPWSEETRRLAESIQEALAGEAGGNGVVIDDPFKPSLERDRPLTAHPLPQPAMPDKLQPKPPIEFRIGCERGCRILAADAWRRL